MEAAIDVAFTQRERPTLVIVRTSIGYGSPTSRTPPARTERRWGRPRSLSRRNASDGRGPPLPRARRRARPFPGGARARETAEKAWRVKFAAYAAAFPALALGMGAAGVGRPPRRMGGGIPTFPPEGGATATRSASGKVAERDRRRRCRSWRADPGTWPLDRDDHQGRGEFLPARSRGAGTSTSGCASTGWGRSSTEWRGTAGDPVRRHLLHLFGLHASFHPPGGADGVPRRLRDDARLRRRGEDGPTHQPVEHLASLRVMPNLYVVRPADANETAAAWRMALERTTVPRRSSLAAETPRPSAFERVPGRRRVSRSLRIGDAGDGRPDVVLIASGSEVSVALAARSCWG